MSRRYKQFSEKEIEKSFLTNKAQSHYLKNEMKAKTLPRCQISGLFPI
jgi:hypothetical protein